MIEMRPHSTPLSEAARPLVGIRSPSRAVGFRFPRFAQAGGDPRFSGAVFEPSGKDVLAGAVVTADGFELTVTGRDRTSSSSMAFEAFKTDSE